MQCTLNENDLLKINNSKNKAVSLINKMLNDWFIHFKDETPIIYDPLAITTIFANTVYFKKTTVEVLLNDNRAKTKEIKGTKNNHYIGTTVNTDYFKEIFFKLFNYEER